jgi:hypothetical protein
MSIFECSICYTSYNNEQNKPLSLPCGHAFCYQCVTKLPDQDSEVFNCPQCKIQIATPIAQLPVCYAIVCHLPTSKEKGSSSKQEGEESRQTV